MGGVDHIALTPTSTTINNPIARTANAAEAKFEQMRGSAASLMRAKTHAVTKKGNSAAAAGMRKFEGAKGAAAKGMRTSEGAKGAAAEGMYKVNKEFHDTKTGADGTGTSDIRDVFRDRAEKRKEAQKARRNSSVGASPAPAEGMRKLNDSAQQDTGQPNEVSKQASAGLDAIANANSAQAVQQTVEQEKAVDLQRIKALMAEHEEASARFRSSSGMP